MSPLFIMKDCISTSNKQETWDLAQEVLVNLGKVNVILLSGNLGAGKTTLAQGLLKHLNAKGPFMSPTFVIMKKYPVDDQFKAVYHIDCYRIEEDDVLNLGWEEIINNKNNLILVEWPERIKKIWPQNYLHIDFKVMGKNQREIKISKNKQ